MAEVKVVVCDHAPPGPLIAVPTVGPCPYCGQPVEEHLSEEAYELPPSATNEFFKTMGPPAPLPDPREGALFKALQWESYTRLPHGSLHVPPSWERTLRRRHRVYYHLLFTAHALKAIWRHHRTVDWDEIEAKR